MKILKDRCARWEVGDNKIRAAFAIFQSKCGAINILLGNKTIILTVEQINNLALSIANIEGFDIDDFDNYYKLKK